MKVLPKKKIKITIKDTYLETLLPRFKEERVRAFLTLATTLIAISIFSFFAINPTLTTIAQLKKQLSDDQFVDQKLVQKIANVSSLQQNYIQIQGSIPNVLSAIPVNPDIPLLSADIQAIGQASQVSVSRISTLPVLLTSDAPTNGFLTYTFNIAAEGSLTNMSHFINAVQSFNRITTIDNISLTKVGNSSNIVDVNIAGKAYFKKQ